MNAKKKYHVRDLESIVKETRLKIHDFLGGNLLCIDFIFLDFHLFLFSIRHDQCYSYNFVMHGFRRIFTFFFRLVLICL